MGSSWRWAELRNSRGSVIHSWGAPYRVEAPGESPNRLSGVNELLVTRPVRDMEEAAGPELGSIRGALPIPEILPRNELAAGFGESGYSVVLDRNRMQLLFHPHRSALQYPLSSLLGPGGWGVDAGLFAAPEGRFSYSEEGVDRVASFVSLADPPWTVISSESLDEFMEPFARSGSFNLLVVLLVTLTISTAFILLTRRATDSLRRLTTAADQVAASISSRAAQAVFKMIEPPLSQLAVSSQPGLWPSTSTLSTSSPTSASAVRSASVPPW